MIGVDGPAALPLLDPPSPQVIVYVQGAEFGPGSVKLAVTVTGLPAVAVRSGPAFTAGVGGPEE